MGLGEMVGIIAVHSMLVELHGGMLTLAAVCILATLVARVHTGMRKTSDSYGVLWPADNFVGKMASYAEPTAYLAAIGALVGLVASAVVGFYIYPLDIVTSSSLGVGKIAVSIFATVLVAVFVVFRSKYGSNLWSNKGTATVYVLVGLIAFLFMIIAGSLGGHMAGKGSVLDPIYSLFGLNPENFGISLSNFPMVTAGVSLLELVVPSIVFMYFQRRSKLRQ
jgi:hypothetical protein